jgi:hypothetical protein
VPEPFETFNGPWALRLLDIPGAWEIYKIAIVGSAGSDGEYAFAPSAEVAFEVDGAEWTLQLGVFLAGGGDPHWDWTETQRDARFDIEQGLLVGIGKPPDPPTDPLHPLIALKSLDPTIDPGPPGLPLDFTVPEDWLID